MTIIGLKPTRQNPNKLTFAVRLDSGVTVRGFTWDKVSQQLSGPRLRVGGGWFFIVTLPEEMWQQLRAMLPQQVVGTSTVATQKA